MTSFDSVGRSALRFPCHIMIINHKLTLLILNSQSKSIKIQMTSNTRENKEQLSEIDVKYSFREVR